MRRVNVNLSPERVSAAIVIAAVLTTAPRHVISALQLEGVVISGVAWSLLLALLSIAFAALEGVSLLQIERAQSVASDAERRRLSIIKWLVYVSIPATFVAPLVAQSQHIKLADLLAGYPAALWLLAALNVAAPMFVISAAAASGSVLSAHERAGVKREPRAAMPEPKAEEPRVRVSKPRARELPEPLELSPEIMPAQAQAEPAPEPIAIESAQAQETAPRAGAIDRAELARLLEANPALTSGALAAHFGVSPAAIRLTEEWKARK